MENFKVYKKGEYVVLVNIKKNEYFYGKAKEVFFDKDNTNITSYKVFNVKDLKEDTVLSIGKIFRENNTAYTELEFEEFYTRLDTESSGTKTYKRVCDDSTNALSIKSEPGNLYSIIGVNTGSAVAYLKLYDQTSVPVSGDNSVMTVPIPANTAGAGIAIPFPTGVNFSIGIAMAVTAGTDGTFASVPNNTVTINLTYV